MEHEVAAPAPRHLRRLPDAILVAGGAGGKPRGRPRKPLLLANEPSPHGGGGRPRLLTLAGGRAGPDGGRAATGPRPGHRLCPTEPVLSLLARRPDGVPDRLRRAGHGGVLSATGKHRAATGPGAGEQSLRLGPGPPDRPAPRHKLAAGVRDGGVRARPWACTRTCGGRGLRALPRQPGTATGRPRALDRLPSS